MQGEDLLMGGYEEHPCPVCGANTYDKEQPFLWRGVVFGTGGNDRGSGSCTSCRKVFKITGSPQMVEITKEEEAKLAKEYGFGA